MIEIVQSDYPSFLSTGKLPTSPDQYHPIADPDIAARIPLVKSTYDCRTCIVIQRKTDEFGMLLNMTGGYPLAVNGTTFRTLEHLYQCMRFPRDVELQKKIIATPSPLIMKRMTKPHRKDGRQDWYQIKIRVMEWCLHIKLAQHYDAISGALDRTGDRLIVETSPDGDFWGALPRPDDSSILVGCNVFGRLLMALRDEYRKEPGSTMKVVASPPISDPLVMGGQITAYNGSSEISGIRG